MTKTLNEKDLAKLKEKLASPIWRIKNLYGVKDRSSGRVVPFKPTPEQDEVIHELIQRKSKRIIILKARQLGMSTVIDIILADQAIWNEDVHCAIIDQTQVDAGAKLSSKVKVAFESMPEMIRDMFEIVKDNSNEFVVKLGDGKASTVSASMKARGGTIQWLHISEWGPIQYEDAKRSEEIVTGALPAAEQGTIIVETTWKGGKGGHLWNLVSDALNTDEEHRTRNDYKVLFFPWWQDKDYTLEGDPSQISEDIIKYFDKLERVLDRKFTNGQKLWYYKMKKKQQLFMFREYPSTLEECFSAPVEGAIFKEALMLLRSQGKVEDFEWDRGHPVHTFWDLGAPENTVVWYVQFIGGRIDIVDVDHQLDITTPERVSMMRSKGYLYGYHYLPHDARQTQRGGLTFERELKGAGLQNLKVIPRTVGIWEGINHALRKFPQVRFHKVADKRVKDKQGHEKSSALEALEVYHRRKDAKTGDFTDHVVHDWSSHYADAFRYIFEADAQGMIMSNFDVDHHPKVRVNKGRRGGFRSSVRVIR